MATIDPPIPLENLTRQYALLAPEIEQALAQVLPTGKYVLGPQLAAFEQEFAAYCQTRFALGISSGTEALHLALAACGIGPGDQVITVPNTYAATVFAISYVGATPIFVDVEPSTFNLDVNQVEAHITPRTKAILPVHMYGQCVDMDALDELARKHNLWVIEDAAHAHGAEYFGRRAGSLGHIGCFSFYPTKVLGAYGDGGAITTNDPELFERVKMLRYMGQRKKYLHEVVGFQQRLGEIQAAILRVKLRHLDEWIGAREKWAALYASLLTELPLILPKGNDESRHVYYLYTIRAPRRDELKAALEQHGIDSQVIYPLPVPFQPAYAHLGYKTGDFPVSDEQLTQILCLPMFPELTAEEVHRIAATIRGFYNEDFAVETTDTTLARPA